MQDREALAAWLRLTLIPGVGPQTQRQLLGQFGLPHTLFATPRSTLRQHVGNKADLLLDTDNQEGVDQALAWAEQPGNHLVTLADAAYPRLLLQTEDPPSLLYVKGRLDLLNTPALAVVGSRNASPQGEQDARAFAATLARQGLTIVSGMALGIDAAAHRGALAENGNTIAVIGTGIDRIYPARNRDLALALAEKGALISEFPLGTPAVAHNFPRRNRIIAGLSLGCLVVEGAVESGSLITARLTGEQGKEVFAIPGSIHSPLSKGCHRLIKQGAKLVECAQDVLEELKLTVPPPPSDPEPDIPSPPQEPSSAFPEEAPVLAALGFDPVSLDTLVQRTGLTADALYAILVRMELAGEVASLPGGRFQRLTAT
ncbi:DNA-processing protein DprA [Azospira inquinata]|uniref:DNA-protecting protein DprA n=1 Tax=Azospira inquinata TaxID=2785627 RepID=A0A975SQV5_9RHOO|nr:DNA-processing protein DprA [Azospira inquinata]QWT47040.1 DNA-processing protein DprA [Azospira inquinata]QWT50330.1 DNA-protecting protein DprA [Azospira inquinata]